LHIEPPNAIEEWSELVAEALWIERRKLKQQVELMKAVCGT